MTKSEKVLAFIGDLHKNQELKKIYPHSSGCTKGVVFPHQQPIPQPQLGVQQFSAILTPTLGVCVDPTGSRISPIRLPPPQTTAAHLKGHLYLQSTGYKFMGSHNPPILGSIICWNDTQNSLYLVHRVIIKDTTWGQPTGRHVEDRVLRRECLEATWKFPSRPPSTSMFTSSPQTLL